MFPASPLARRCVLSLTTGWCRCTSQGFGLQDHEQFESPLAMVQEYIAKPAHFFSLLVNVDRGCVWDEEEDEEKKEEKGGANDFAE